jgi:hypothetical protein
VRENDPFISVTIDIAAPQTRVWQILTAFEDYATWHPVLSLNGPVPDVAVGAELPMRLSGGVAGDQEFTGEIVEVDAPRRLAWQGGVPGVFLGRHSFDLVPLSEGITRFTDTERWSGSMAASVIAEHRTALEQEYTRSAEALKAVAEAHDA